MQSRPAKEDETVNPWLYRNVPFESVPINCRSRAFVYIIEHEPSGLKYIGSKTLYNVKTLPR